MELAGTARRRLEFLDAPEALLKHLERSGEVQRHVTVSAPASGLVTARNIARGSRIGPADVALEIADLSRVWVMADLYEADLARVKVGMPASLELPALGRKLQGRVAFLDPLLDPKTRTLKARLEFPNPGGELRLRRKTLGAAAATGGRGALRLYDCRGDDGVVPACGSTRA